MDKQLKCIWYFTYMQIQVLATAFLAFGCTPLAVLAQLLTSHSFFWQFPGLHYWDWSVTNRDFVQSTRGSMEYLGAAGNGSGDKATT